MILTLSANDKTETVQKFSFSAVFSDLNLHQLFSLSQNWNTKPKVSCLKVARQDKFALSRVKALYQISKVKLNYPMLCKDTKYSISSQRPYINKGGSRIKLYKTCHLLIQFYDRCAPLSDKI